MTVDLNLSGGPFAAVDRAALRHNLQVVRNIAPQSRVLAVVKANAYGHGLVPVAQALIAADGFGVARLREAVALREAGIGQTIVLLEGVFSHAEFDAAARLNFELVVHSFEQIDALETWHGSRPLSVWCKIDTGMNRLGFRAEDFPAAWSRLVACRNVQSKLRVMTHLADADEHQDARTPQQIAQFNSLVKDLNVERSIGNSAGTLAWPESRVEWVRPGLMLYGMSPFDDSVANDLGLQPAMTLTTPLISVRDVKAGEKVGYGGTWQAAQDSRIGIAAVGYGDGYPRHVRSGAPVLIRGQSAQIAGRVSMDMIAIDLSTMPRASAAAIMPGDTVVLWGKGLPAERVARHADTIPYELVCGISQRVAMGYR
ncbi:MAG TPA: alanine racemase [Steroidobacteraceae bacterium]|nr:alanine racemase [Steroidobacteraceae bacterium]